MPSDLRPQTSDLIIAIDGPAGSGKGTVAKRLAKELDLRYLDTGAMYRAVALLACRHGLGPNDGEAAAALAQKSSIEFGTGDPQPVFLDREDTTEAIRSLEVGELASALSAFPAVRRVLVERQREILREGGAVLEGRDTTTVVAPDADVKVFLTASLEERARRRFEELRAKGLDPDFEELKADVAARDQRDSTRADSPLKVADGATVIDTTEMSIEEVVAVIRRLAEKALSDER